MKIKYEEINGTNGYKLEDFVVFDVPNDGIPFNLFTRIETFLNSSKNIPVFDDDRKLIDNIYSNYVLIEYSNKDIRNNDIKNNTKINILNPIKSESINGDKQLAENVGNFEYNGKYYLVVYPYNALTNQTDIDLGLYKGIIINSDKYFEVENQLKTTNDEVKDTLAK